MCGSPCVAYPPLAIARAPERRAGRTAGRAGRAPVRCAAAPCARTRRTGRQLHRPPRRVRRRPSSDRRGGPGVHGRVRGGRPLGVQAAEGAGDERPLVVVRVLPRPGLTLQVGGDGQQVCGPARHRLPWARSPGPRSEPRRDGHGRELPRRRIRVEELLEPAIGGDVVRGDQPPRLVPPAADPVVCAGAPREVGRRHDAHVPVLAHDREDGVGRQVRGLGQHGLSGRVRDPAARWSATPASR